MGVGTISHDVNVISLGATDLDAEMPGRAMQKIQGDVDVADTSARRRRS